MSARPRSWIPVTAVAAVVLATLLAWAPQLDSTPRRLVCTVLPNGVVPVLASPDGSCPLWAYDRIRAFDDTGTRIGFHDLAALEASLLVADRSLRVEVERGGTRLWQTVPVATETRGRQLGRFVAASVVSGILLAMGLLVYWNSLARAATPFLVFYACVSVLVVVVLSGRASPALLWVQLAATGAISASLVHLALTFPRERDLLRRMPSVVVWPYVTAAALVALQRVAFETSLELWRAFDQVLLATGVGAWSVLVLGCVLALRESVAPLERARARVLLRGVVLVPAVIVGLSLLASNALPAGAAWRAGLGVMALPLPIGYAIARYQLFDLGRDVRQAIVYLLQLAAVSALLSLAWTVGVRAFDLDLPIDDPLVVFACGFLGLLVADPLRVVLRGLLDGWSPPRRTFLRQLAEEQAERLAELRTPEEQAEILCGAALLGLGARGATLCLRVGDEWAFVCTSGEAPRVAAALAGTAAVEATRGTPIHLARLEQIERGSPSWELQHAGVEVLAPLRCGTDTFGCLLVGPSRSGFPYGSEHVAFLHGVAARAAVALQNGALLQDLVSAERFATLGRVTAGLAHEIGKPLGVLERLAQRLPDRLHEAERVQRDIGTIASLATEMRTTVQDLLGAARREAAGGNEGPSVRLESLFERAIAEVSRLHGPGRVARRLAPAFPDLPPSALPLLRVIVNLLDNALRATAPDDVVELRAQADATTLHIEVIDRGTGMSADLLRLAQQPFFSTRAPGAGTGLGLFVSRRIVHTLGGTLSLRSVPGAGTRAHVTLPVARDGVVR